MLDGEGVCRYLEDDANELGYYPISEQVRSHIVSYHHKASPPLKSGMLPNENVTREGGNAPAKLHYTVEYTNSRIHQMQAEPFPFHL